MKLRLTIEGKVYEVGVEVLEEEGQHRGQARPVVPSSAAAAPIAAAAVTSAARPAPGTGPADNDKILRSPISGVVVRVPAQVGQMVKENDDLVVIEAMKMETVIASQCAGKISKIHVVAGDSVQAQQELVEYE